MLIALLSRWACNICSYLYPAYASYKALSLHPDSSPEAMIQVERWLMYWAVVGTWTAFEAVLGWTFTWLPFYSLIKTVIFLYFSLPQSEGSSYIYRTHLAPFFQEHESDIDSFLASLRTRATTALAGGIGWLWEKAKAQLNIALPAGQQTYGSGIQNYDNGVEGFAVPGVQQPPTLQDPASGAVQQMYGLLSHYTGRYMPVALSALTAAAGAAQQRVQPRSQEHPQRAEQVAESIAMPVPVPTAGVRMPSDNTLRSRTYLHATAAGSPSPQAVASGRLNRDPNAGRPISGSGRPSPNPSASTSEESLSTQSQLHRNRWSGEMSYESIAREEAVGAPSGNGNDNGRPGMEKRGSSWFGWGGPSGASGSPRPKAE
ncbi:hypothetical protein I317_00164 [Kwoniella heveanensis CBS 569]|nr:hypothetical protein I317_00164 [Kwoniella heveanensis CBS 569]